MRRFSIKRVNVEAPKEEVFVDHDPLRALTNRCNNYDIVRDCAARVSI